MFNLNRRRIQQNHQHTPWHELWRQPLAALIRMPWAVFFGTMVLIYISEILIFALIFSLDASNIKGDPVMGIPRPISFAVGAFFANTFDDLSPNSPFVYGVAVLDLIAGLVTLSTLTAVVFSRLSSNEMPLIFSRHLCISNTQNGHLFCRFVTSDKSQWLNVNYSLSLIYDDEPESGLWQRRIVPLSILNQGTPQLSQTATLTHQLDEQSPIFLMGIEELQRRNAVIMPLVEGIDESTGSGLLQTHLYSIKDVLTGYRYGDLVSTDKRGQRHLNIQKLNNIETVGGATQITG
ncbi:hypothetical protein [Cyanobium sp. WAJ14-Wanaka]|uniref:hypothetical protein n=1 Tax=Cyanobium sp. WAJ14-Wanaka TaxID=2823725 RepID=UPI0020CE7FB9|nr:hypothetical protein [Cyanobium sp. WAJ14-Wanaka]MCP9774846.1 hypothetical protein [Cyanobium sp. WAJ14-Wanaka]